MRLGGAMILPLASCIVFGNKRTPCTGAVGGVLCVVDGAGFFVSSDKPKVSEVGIVPLVFKNNPTVNANAANPAQRGFGRILVFNWISPVIDV